MSLALFPLNTVLFPGCTLDLQLFEARYLDMISRCMKKGESFGVVCILDGKEVGMAPDGYALIGCEALIRDFKQQDNGLLGIRVEGGRRFRVLDTGVQKDQLLVAEVQWLDEQPDQPLDEEDADLLALLQAPGRASDGLFAGHGRSRRGPASLGQSACLSLALYRGRQDRPAATRRPAAAPGCDPDAA